jgi:cytochrome c553
MIQMARLSRILLISSVFGLLLLAAMFSLAEIRVGLAQATTPVATAAATRSAPPKGDAERGKLLVQVMNCVGCHSTPSLAAADGTIPLAGGNEFKAGDLGTVYANNLTELGGWSFDEFDKALRQGIEPFSGRVLLPVMPYQRYQRLTDADVASIAEYIISLKPVPNPAMKAPVLTAAAEALKPLPPQVVTSPAFDGSAAHGEYVVQVLAGCGSCHNPSGAAGRGREFSGGTRNLGTEERPIYAPPILGSVLKASGYSAENFTSLFRNGIRPRGAPLAPQMNWRRFSGLSDTELLGVWTFLDTRKLDTPWPVPTAPPTQPPPAPATTVATAAPTAAR